MIKLSYWWDSDEDEKQKPAPYVTVRDRIEAK